MIRNVGTADYQFVQAKHQAAGRAVCPYCMAWHLRSTGAPEGDEACEALYVRVRKVAIVVRGKPTHFGAGVRTPTSSEIKSAVAHAVGVITG
jgi:hypothetical protein